MASPPFGKESSREWITKAKRLHGNQTRVGWISRKHLASGRGGSFFLTSLPRNRLRIAPLLCSGGRVWPSSVEVSGFAVGGIGSRSTQSLCRRIADRTSAYDRRVVRGGEP